MSVRNTRLLGWVFFAPSLVFIVAVVLFPLAYGGVLSFMRYALASPGRPRFVGLANYVHAFGSAQFWHSVEISVFYVVVGTILQLSVATAMAVFLSARDFPGKSFVIALLVMPTTIAMVVVGFDFVLLYSGQYGPLNYLLNWVGIPSVPWLYSHQMAPVSIVIANAWEWTPFIMLGLVAAIYAIPGDLNDAAKVDGASGWQLFWFVTLPLIEPTMIILAVIRGIEDFKLFDIVYVLTQGGPGTATENLNMYAFRQGFQFFNLGYASCLSFIQLAIVLVLVRALYQRVMATQEARA